MRFIERGNDACGSAAFAEERAAWVGSARHPAVWATVCSGPRTSPKMEFERFVVRRKERVARSAGQPVSASRAQFVAGSVSGSNAA